MTVFELRKVAEAEVDRFLDLVDVLVGQVDARDVCLDEFDPVGGVRVGSGFHQRLVNGDHSVKIPSACRLSHRLKTSRKIRPVKLVSFELYLEFVACFIDCCDRRLF